MSVAAATNIMGPGPQATLGVVQGLKVIGADWEDDKLVVTVEGPNISAVNSADARKLAYMTRVRYGMSSAGIEDFGGPYPYDPNEKKDLETAAQMNEARKGAQGLVYRAKFRLTSSAI